MNGMVEAQLRIVLKSVGKFTDPRIDEFFHLLDPDRHPPTGLGSHVPVGEAARILSVSPGYVRILLCRGLLKRHTAEGRKYASGVSLESLHDFINGKERTR